MNDDNRHTFGQFLRHRRQQQGLSLKDVAVRAGVSKTFVYDVENGTVPIPPLPRLRALARALDLDEAELLDVAGHLPEMGPYLRAKYDLPEPSAEQVEAFVRFIQQRAKEEGGRDEPSTDTERAA